MDLNTIKTVNRKVNLCHPVTGDELGLVFELRAPNSDEVKDVSRAWQNKRLSPKFRNKRIDALELEAVTDNRIKAAVIGWEWEGDIEEISLNGEQLEYSPKVLKGWLRDLPFIREFLSDECEDVSSFYSD